MPRKKSVKNGPWTLHIEPETGGHKQTGVTFLRGVWNQAKMDIKRAFEGKLPKGDCWIVTKMPWMTDEGWEDYQKRLSEVDYKEKKKKR